LSGLLQVSPGNCFVPWLVLSSIQFVVFLLLVVVTSFWWCGIDKLQFCVRYGGWIGSW
jgi:hypothetical protein